MSVSGIPRLSRLPVPSGHTRESTNAIGKPVTRLNGLSGNSAQLHSTSKGTQNRSSTAEFKVPINVEALMISSSSGRVVTSGDSLNFGAASDAKVIDGMSDAPVHQPETPREKRKPRPSLSDRTIETLSQIPPSPLSCRRRSSFFNLGKSSPMAPPLRPASAMSDSRSRPQSPVKRPPMPAIPVSFVSKSQVRPLPGRRSMTQPAKPSAGKKTGKMSDMAPGCTSRSATVLSKPMQSQHYSKSMSSITHASSSQESSLCPAPLLNRPLARPGPIAAKSAKFSTASAKVSSSFMKTATPSGPHQSGGSSPSSLRSCFSKTDLNVDPPCKPLSKSSAALRDAITKARQEVTKKGPHGCRVRQGAAVSAQSGTEMALGGCVSGSDRMSDSLMKRIRGALFSGHLNVAAMGLKIVPIEIKHMYDACEDAGATWSEYVDLTKFNAADNHLERLDDDIFPDTTDAELEDMEGAGHNGQLRGLETLDLHSNLLMELPLGLRKLQKLRSLNLSGNRLGMHAFKIISQVGHDLSELKMANNELSGILPDHITKLHGLQLLDLHGNSISELPEALRELVNLRVVNLAQNKLSSKSFNRLTNLSLVELIMSSNRLSGTLFPAQNSPIMESLKLLDVSHNMLDTITGTEIGLARIQTLDLSGNRLKSLPDISSWRELLTFSIAKNVVAEIPKGFFTLQRLRNADLSNNNITKVDSGLLSMQNLVSLNLAGNPLRERKYLTMATDDLKTDLTNRYIGPERSPGGATEEDVYRTTPHLGSEGILDWSSRSLPDIEVQTLHFDGSVFDVRLQHNALNAIPISLLSMVSICDTLKSLNMSNNVFQGQYLHSHLTLPRLKDLSLVACRLADLDDLTTYLSAPNLITLNVSANNLCGGFPQLRVHFPVLTTIFAADNHFSGLEDTAVKGLTTLDIRNNELDHLEPRLGLLGGQAGLKCLEVSGNKFRVPRWDVVQKGTKAILLYLKGRLPLEEVGIAGPEVVLHGES